MELVIKDARSPLVSGEQVPLREVRVGDNTVLVLDNSPGETKVSFHGEAVRLQGLYRPDEPFLTSRPMNPRGTSFKIGNVKVGKGLVVIAGPCSVESRDHMMELAHALGDAGADVLRGGVYKPRTSPYSFQGLGMKGLEILRDAGNAVDMPVVSEIMNLEQLEEALIYIDMVQVGSRNMYNYPLLKQLGASAVPVLLKRGFMATLKEFLFAAEYLMLAGGPNVLLCERGIRTFERSTRNTLDISAVPVLREMTHLPVCVDPSHAAGRRALVPSLARAAVVAGAHAIMLEVHPDPDRAFSDGSQSLTVQQAKELIPDLKNMHGLVHQAWAET